MTTKRTGPVTHEAGPEAEIPAKESVAGLTIPDLTDENRRAALRAIRQRAHIETAQRRERVLLHQDLAVRLTRPPLNYNRPDQWSGVRPVGESGEGRARRDRRRSVATRARADRVVSEPADLAIEGLIGLAEEILKPKATQRPVYGSSTVSRIRRTNAELADIDDAIVAAVEDEHPVTLRGVFYRVVSAGAVEKTENGYRLIGRQLLKLRRDRVVPYGWITDGTRWIRQLSTWTDLDAILENAAASYRRALWHNQPTEVYVFTEKDAISGVIRPVVNRWDVPLGVLRGYSSESFAYSAAEVIRADLKRGKEVYVYQLGDHDPSGVDAWRDFTAKVREFVAAPAVAHGLASEVLAAVNFERLAVTTGQIETLNLPTRPTKRTDTRSKHFTGGSVEVDAIPAPTLRRLVEAAIVDHIDPEKLRLTRIAEESEREVLSRMIGPTP
jgi:hypothetical protein